MTDTQRGAAATPGKVETRDARPRGVLLGMGVFIALLIIGLGVSAVLLWQLNRSHAPSAAAQAQGDIQPPPPRLQTDPRAERMAIEARARKRLAEAPVPVDKAMHDVVARGWDR